MFDTSKRLLFPANIQKITPYVADKTIAEVRETYQPKQISKLTSNENRLGCSPAVKPAIQDVFKEIRDYPDPASRKLRADLAAKHGVSPENIIVSAGSESVIANLCRTFFRDNDEAITADATFVGFFVQANIQDVVIQKIPITTDYRFNTQSISEAVTDHTKMIYLANPNNPTGTYITKNEFEALMNTIRDDILVVMDEAYYEFAEDVEDYPHALDYDHENVIILRTFSKAYGLAGLRVGYAIAQKNLIDPMTKTKLTFEPRALNDEAFINRGKEVVREGRQQLYDFFDGQNVDYVESISNSVLMVCEMLIKPEVLHRECLNKALFYVVLIPLDYPTVYGSLLEQNAKCSILKMIL